MQLIPWVRERWRRNVGRGAEKPDEELAALKQWGELPMFKELKKLYDTIYTSIKQGYCQTELLRDPPSDEQVVTSGALEHV